MNVILLRQDLSSYKENYALDNGETFTVHATTETHDIIRKLLKVKT